MSVVSRVLCLAMLLVSYSAFATPVCVSAGRATMRAGPSGKERITWVVGKYMPFKKVGAKGAWSKVEDVDGETHWTESKNLTTRINCVVVKAKTANLRRAPSSSSEFADIPIADKYTPFKKLERDDAWLHLEDSYKDQYWASDTVMWWPVNRANISF
jgi:SH3-like domain-containing protein